MGLPLCCLLRELIISNLGDGTRIPVPGTKSVILQLAGKNAGQILRL
ncbi:hypothetical protein [[Phormidium] sp. ETS-05]|nr:hypothetical protein [[Phormidium] sp. ETS-05]